MVYCSLHLFFFIWSQDLYIIYISSVVMLVWMNGSRRTIWLLESSPGWISAEYLRIFLWDMHSLQQGETIIRRTIAQHLKEAVKLYTILIFAVYVNLIHFRTSTLFAFGKEQKCKCLFCSPPVHPRLPISFWASLLDLLAFGSPLAAHTVDATWTCNSLRLQALRWLLEGKLHHFAFLEAAEAFHVQLALKGRQRN